MSELEQEAATWIPPWQREPAPSTNDALAADAIEQDLIQIPSDAESAPNSTRDGIPITDAAPAPADALPVQRDRVPAQPAGPEPVQAAEAEPTAQWDNHEQLAGVTDDELTPALEAILMVVDEPVTEIMLAQVLEIPAERVADALLTLSAAYTEEKRGFELRRAAGGWRFYTRSEYAPYVEKFVLDGQQLRLTQASLETLAVIAYKQPVTRGRISAIRGVNCDGVIRTLVTRGMIEECGSDPDSGAHLYRTTTLFLEKLGLDSVEQLPSLAPFLPSDLDELSGALDG